MARGLREEFRVLFLDRKNILIADEVQSAGTIDHTPVYPREIVKRALELGASALILVHNHPSGDPDAQPRRHRDDARDRRRRPSRCASPSTTTSSSAAAGMPASSRWDFYNRHRPLYAGDPRPQATIVERMSVGRPDKPGDDGSYGWKPP